MLIFNISKQLRNGSQGVFAAQILVLTMGKINCSSAFQRHEWLKSREKRVANTIPKAMQWTDRIVDKILKKVEIRKFIITAFKSIQKLVKLQSLVAKRCKMWKMYACEDCKFCIFLYYARKIDTNIDKTVSIQKEIAKGNLLMNIII